MSRGTWRRARHLEPISEVVARAALDGGVRAIINTPPRHGKSQLISRWGSTYAFDVRPDVEIMILAYGADLAEGWSRQVREDLAHPEHAAKVHPRSSARSAWQTTAGGQLVAAGLGGAVTGKGADIAIIDDPFKNREEAESQVYRDRVWNAFTSTVYTRLSPNASVIITQTRWHHDDLTGRILQQMADGIGDRYEVVNLPALAEEADPLGRAPGDALWPERFSAAKLRAIRQVIGEADWAALYQGRPNIDGAGFFPVRGQWATYRDRPDPGRFRALVASIDTNLVGGPGSDPFVCLVWGVDREGDRLWLLDRFWTRAGWGEATRALSSFLTRQPMQISDVVIERKALGAALASLLRESNIAKRVYEFRPDPYGSKEARATAAGKFVEAGMVVVPDPTIHPWVADYWTEIEQFPRGRHDDQVDATTQVCIAAFIERALHYGVAGIGDSFDRLSGSSRFA